MFVFNYIVTTPFTICSAALAFPSSFFFRICVAVAPTNGRLWFILCACQFLCWIPREEATFAHGDSVVHISFHSHPKTCVCIACYPVSCAPVIPLARSVLNKTSTTSSSTTTITEQKKTLKEAHTPQNQ